MRSETFDARWPDPTAIKAVKVPPFSEPTIELAEWFKRHGMDVWKAAEPVCCCSSGTVH